MGQKRILVVEDEPGIAENILYALKTEGFDGVRASTAFQAADLLSRGSFDLVIMDVGLPDETGFELCRKLRSTSRIPIFFLTARTEEIDRVLGLEIGGDDYITKPFSPRELTARIRSFFRRWERDQSSQESRSIIKAGFKIEEDKKRVSFSDRDLGLSRTEYLILRSMMVSSGIVFSRSQLMEKAWDQPDMSLERTIDAHIKSIRAKIRVAGGEDAHLATHRGFGYSFEERL